MQRYAFLFNTGAGSGFSAPQVILPLGPAIPVLSTACVYRMYIEEIFGWLGELGDLFNETG